MGIFDVFTGGAQKEAAGINRALFNQTRDEGIRDINEATGRSLFSIGTGFNNGRDAFTRGYTDATGAVRTGATDALGHLGRGTDDALGALARSRTDLTNAGEAWRPISALAERYGRGSRLYEDALGINGPEGNTRATSAFTPSLSYDFNLTQGLDAINRRRAAGGMLDSGNADRDAQLFGAGTASNELQGWLSRLQGFQPLELQAATTAATGNADIGRRLADLGLTEAGIHTNMGVNRAGISTELGRTLANLGSTYGANIAGLSTDQAGREAGLYTGASDRRVGLNTGTADRVARTFTDAAAAETAGSANTIKFGMEALKTLASLAGGIPGMGGGAGGAGMGGLGAR